jgi:hypothetical protein
VNLEGRKLTQPVVSLLTGVHRGSNAADSEAALSNCPTEVKRTVAGGTPAEES